MYDGDGGDDPSDDGIGTEHGHGYEGCAHADRTMAEGDSDDGDAYADDDNAA